MTDDSPDIELEDEEQARELIEAAAAILTEHWDELAADDRERLTALAERARPEDDQPDDEG